MKVSVIIPVHNGEAYLSEALASVFAQTSPAHEIIIVDDGSTDSSPEILRSFGDRLSVVRQENQGVAAARNVGLGLASGDAIAFLDQDDLWPEDRNRAMVEILAKDPVIDVVAGLVEIRDERRANPNTGENLETMRREMLVGSLLVRASLFATLGKFSTNVGYGDDSDFWVRRMESQTPTAFYDGVSLTYRKHDNNTSADSQVSNFHMLSVFRESLKRRRASSK